MNLPEFSQLQDRHKHHSSFASEEVRLGVIQELAQGYAPLSLQQSWGLKNPDLDPKTCPLSSRFVLCFILSIFKQHWGSLKV